MNCIIKSKEFYLKTFQCFPHFYVQYIGIYTMNLFVLMSVSVKFEILRFYSFCHKLLFWNLFAKSQKFFYGMNKWRPPSLSVLTPKEISIRGVPDISVLSVESCFFRFKQSLTTFYQTILWNIELQFRS